MATREPYKFFLPITTRWMDNDIYGHVNNVVYYSWFDTVVNTFLITNGKLDIQNPTVIGVCVESSCQYKKSVSFPNLIEGGLCVSNIGNSSVTYQVGIFLRGETVPVASGYFVHVFVDKISNKPVPIPSAIKEALQSILSSTSKL